MKKNNNEYAIIMAGGIGTRFWPLSTTKKPKQFHDVLGTGRTFIQMTFDRLKKIVPVENIFVVTSQEYVDITMEQLSELHPLNIIREPQTINTAACNLLASLIIRKINPKGKIIVAPSDHLILNEDNFRDQVNFAFEQCDSEKLITLGMKPTRPETGYGYIQYNHLNSERISKVISFTEKPSLEIAETLVQSGEFLWNSGIFIWSAEAILNAFQEHLPNMYQILNAYFDSGTNNEVVLKSIYSTLAKVSIDVAILEKSKNVFVIPSSFDWTDLGTWNSLFEYGTKNEEANITKGKHIQTYNTKGSIIYNTTKKAMIIDGLENYIVVDTKDGLLICPKENDQDIKTYVNDLKLNKGDRFC